jgi:two-component system OmpR family response regulator
MRILLIEDDRATADYIAKGLQEIGHVVQVARTGRDGMLLAAGEAWDVIVTDRMLPGPDGLTILRTLRASGITTPVLVLTALGEVERRVEGLDAGADDYLAKPFAFSELRARIAALARRPTPTTDPVLLQVADIELDLLKRVVRRNGQPVELLPTEMRLLEFMLRRPGQVLTKTMLLEGVWDLNFDPSTNLVEVHVSRLRRKLSQEGSPAPIQTMRGVGYMLGAPK